MIRHDQKKYEITITERLLGSQPLNKQLRHDYITKKALEAADNAKADCTEEDCKEEESMIRDEEKGMTGFYSDPDGCYLLDYQVKGFLKEAANRLKESLKIKNLRDKVSAYLFVFPRFIWIAEKPDGVFERSLKAMTMQGPRTTLAASEYLDPPIIFTISLTLLPHKELTWGVVEELFDYGRFQGLGQWRGAGNGRFEVRSV